MDKPIWDQLRAEPVELVLLPMTVDGVMARSEAPALAKAVGNSYPLRLPPPRQSSTLQVALTTTAEVFLRDFNRAPRRFPTQSWARSSE